MTQKEREFWTFLDLLVAQHPVVIDRPKGSYHPEHPQSLYPKPRVLRVIL